MKYFLLLFVLTVSGIVGSQTVGTIQLNENLVQEGYTLVSPLNNNSTYLIDHCGAIVNQWDSSYPPGNEVFLDEEGNLWRSGRPTIEGAVGAGGRGGIIELFDWDGQLIWSYERCDESECLHHEFELLPNGNLLILVWDKYSADEAINQGADPLLLDDIGGVWSEYLEEISPNLEENNSAISVWKWHAWDHLIQDYSEGSNFGVVGDHPEKIDLNFGQLNTPDWLHANALDYNSELDEIIISIPNFNEFWIIDHNTTTEEASGVLGDLKFRWGNPIVYDQGEEEDTQLFFSHNAHWVKQDFRFGGDIIVFNNRNMVEDTMVSSVDVISPYLSEDGNYSLEMNTYLPSEPSFQYFLPDSLASNKVSGVQVLENGNLLICSGVNGTLMEITETGELAWYYIIPINDLNEPFTQGEDASGHVRWLFRGYKYATDFSGFTGRDMSPGFNIELGSDNSYCQVNVISENYSNELKVYPNPTYDKIHINSNIRISQVRVFNSYKEQLISTNENVVDLSRLSSGVYLIEVELINGEKSYSKLIKE